jgi:hypothetical protein
MHSLNDDHWRLASNRPGYCGLVGEFVSCIQSREFKDALKPWFESHLLYSMKLFMADGNIDMKKENK